MERILDVVSQFGNTDIRDGFTEDEIRDLEHGEEQRELTLDGLPIEAFDGMFTAEEIEQLNLEQNPLDVPEETDLEF